MPLTSDQPEPTSQKELVQKLLDDKRLNLTSSVAQIMEKVDRKNFVDPSNTYGPYEYRAPSIGYGATISAPYIHADALVHFEQHLKPGMKVLDVGSGSGYLVACFAEWLGPTSTIVGIDHIEHLVEQSKENIKKGNANLLNGNNVKLVVGDGRKGWKQEGPYDAIHVGAGASMLHNDLIEQLNSPGVLILPVILEDKSQVLKKIEKNSQQQITETVLRNVKFIPLTSKEEQLKN
ncbi:hypothetical protein HK099_000746 [Clydaea vesicula]|uniref:Protein-L-isoaspartate O-methyltransferase n=1 Tax=Clydaea vesicula TaxID=447962 RepID=A0AAD5U466_9FUNG|nr:hypothetical protein HK099_000746 [Clydaea vesicula]KAJ3389158.1 hypothetical protein HDU92_001154 [Lobulomyces angularis]